MHNACIHACRSTSRTCSSRLPASAAPRCAIATPPTALTSQHDARELALNAREESLRVREAAVAERERALRHEKAVRPVPKADGPRHVAAMPTSPRAGDVVKAPKMLAPPPYMRA